MQIKCHNSVPQFIGLCLPDNYICLCSYSMCIYELSKFFQTELICNVIQLLIREAFQFY